MRAVLRYPGSKSRIAPWIVSHFPRHAAYIEPFFGSGTVLFAKPRADSEIVNDLDGSVVNFFRVLRDRPKELVRAMALTPWAREEFEQCFEAEAEDELERARRFAIYWWQAVGCRGVTATSWCVDYCGKAEPARSVIWMNLPERLRRVAERLQGVQIERRDAVELIERCQYPNVLLYCDPPYLGNVRHGRLYREEMRGQDEHERLIEALRRHQGAVLLSAYESDFYQERLDGWEKRTREAMSQTNTPRQEVLWLNEKAASALQQRLPGL